MVRGAMGKKRHSASGALIVISTGRLVPRHSWHFRFGRVAVTFRGHGVGGNGGHRCPADLPAASSKRSRFDAFGEPFERSRNFASRRTTIELRRRIGCLVAGKRRQGLSTSAKLEFRRRARRQNEG